MEKKSFVLYYDNYVWVSRLCDTDKAYLLDLLFLYGMEVERRDVRPADFLSETGLVVSGELSLVFGFMGDSIYRDTQKCLRAKMTRDRQKAAKLAAIEAGETV